MIGLWLDVCELFDDCFVKGGVYFDFWEKKGSLSLYCNCKSDVNVKSSLKKEIFQVKHIKLYL
jgi:hypothetical protein